jgi:predicted RNA-binding Zn-ribbon protein involved in translation (DUF1610 family)
MISPNTPKPEELTIRSQRSGRPQAFHSSHASITKNQSGKVQASLNKTCPKCGFMITPDQVKRVDSEQIECPKCGEKFRPKREALKAITRFLFIHA